MEPTTQEKLVKRLHAHSGMIVLVITGGGSSAISSLLRQGGASNTLLDAEVPYAASALIRWLGKEPEQFCSGATARAMAMVAFERAKHLYDEETDQVGQPQIPLAGISCTASLASNRPKRGDHRIHLAAQTFKCTWTSHLRLIKGHRTRQQEEDLAGDMLVQWIAKLFGLSQKWDLPLADGEEIQTHKMVAPAPWQDLLSGTRKKVLALGESGNERQRVPALFPGAFNPLHQGHLLMAKIAGKKLGVAIDFEISTLNVDKPPMDYWEMQQRLKQFTDQLSNQQFSIGQRNEKKRL